MVLGFAALTKLMGMQVTSALAAQDFDCRSIVALQLNF